MQFLAVPVQYTIWLASSCFKKLLLKSTTKSYHLGLILSSILLFFCIMSVLHIICIIIFYILFCIKIQMLFVFLIVPNHMGLRRFVFIK